MVNNMKIAVFSDIHGNYQALESILKDIKGKKIDKTIFLGDAVSLGPDSNKCLDLLFKEKVTFILGNHELYCTKGVSIDPDSNTDKRNHNLWITSNISKQNLNKLKEQKLSYELSINNKKYTFIHFLLDKKTKYPFKHLSIFRDDTYKKEMDKIDSDYIFYGHEHTGRIDFINGKEFYAIGSSGCRTDNTTYYHIIDTKKNKVKKINIYYDRKTFIKSINNKNYPNIENINQTFFGIKKEDLKN